MKQEKKIRLLVRADDAGSSLASNIGCLKACIGGIATSIEVMSPGGWVEHLAHCLGRLPDIDVGIHLTLTSEWDNIKWRPLTAAPSLVGKDGYFRPLLLPRHLDNRPNLKETMWCLDDIAQEFRAQIAFGLKRFPQASHVSAHMIRNFEDFDPHVSALVNDLCKEFGLMNDPMGNAITRFDGYPKLPRDKTARINSFVDRLASLQEGTHIFVDHPAEASPELAALGHEGYDDVCEDRGTCLSVLLSASVKSAIRHSDIELITYRQLQHEAGTK
ncbi:MAG: ChbG/HpnK family deacetylase [Stappiaceae bacterium]